MPDADNDAGLFIGSSALMTALYDTYTEHIGVTETEGPDGPYIWCACGWRSDDLLSGPPGQSYAVHLTNAQHAAAVKALQPIVRRIIPGLHRCVGCGLELDADDPNDLCDECVLPPEGSTDG